MMVSGDEWKDIAVRFALGVTQGLKATPLVAERGTSSVRGFANRFGRSSSDEKEVSSSSSEPLMTASLPRGAFSSWSGIGEEGKWRGDDDGGGGVNA
jgi:hypothetical protein